MDQIHENHPGTVYNMVPVLGPTQSTGVCVSGADAWEWPCHISISGDSCAPKSITCSCRISTTPSSLQFRLSHVSHIFLHNFLFIQYKEIKYILAFVHSLSPAKKLIFTKTIFKLTLFPLFFSGISFLFLIEFVGVTWGYENKCGQPMCSAAYCLLRPSRPWHAQGLPGRTQGTPRGEKTELRVVKSTVAAGHRRECPQKVRGEKPTIYSGEYWSWHAWGRATQARGRTSWKGLREEYWHSLRVRNSTWLPQPDWATSEFMAHR